MDSGHSVKLRQDIRQVFHTGLFKTGTNLIWESESAHGDMFVHVDFFINMVLDLSGNTDTYCPQNTVLRI